VQALCKRDERLVHVLALFLQRALKQAEKKIKAHIEKDVS
jgi:hypothetical protein